MRGKPFVIAIAALLLDQASAQSGVPALPNFSVPKIPTVGINAPAPKLDPYGNPVPAPAPANPNPNPNPNPSPNSGPVANDNLTPQQRLFNQILGRQIPLGKVADPVGIWGKPNGDAANLAGGTGGSGSSSGSDSSSVSLGGSGSGGSGSGSGGSGSGSGGKGSGSGGGGAAGSGLEGGAAINQVGTGGGGSGGGGGGAGRPPQVGGGGPRYPRRPEKKNFVWPICVFVADDVPEGTANQMVKGMIDMAAKCDVATALTIVTARGMRDDPNYINQQQIKGCNAQVAGYPRASTTAITNFHYTAAEMCGGRVPRNSSGPQFDENVAGCAQLAQNSRVNDDDLRTPSEGELLTKSTGGVAPSIEVDIGLNSRTLAHEVYGHTQMGMPNGRCLGNGIGYPPAQEQCQSPAGDGWTPDACAIMRNQAFPNVRQVPYDPTQLTYYRTPGDQRRVYDFAAARPLFNPLNPPPPQDQIAARKPQGLGNRPDAVITYDSTPRGGGGVTTGGGNGTPAATPPGAGHKKGAGGAQVAGAPAGGAAGGGDQVNVTSLRKGEGGANPTGSGGVTSKITYDAKAKPGQNQPGAIPDGEGGAGGKPGNGGTSKYEYDSSKGGGSTDIANSLFGNGGGGKTSAGDAAGAAGELASATGANGPGGGLAGGKTTVNGRAPSSTEDSFDPNFFKGVGKVADDKPRPRGESLRPSTGRVQSNIYGQ